MSYGGGLKGRDVIGEGQIIITASMDPAAKKAITDFLGSLQQIVRGDKLAQYFDNLDEVVSRFTASLSRFKSDKSDFNARQLINDFNALEGLAASNGRNFASLFDGIKGGLAEVKKSIIDAQAVARGTSFDGITAKAVKDINDAGKVIREWGADVNAIFNEVSRNASKDELIARIEQLNESLAKETAAKNAAIAANERYRKSAEKAAEAEQQMKEKYNETFNGDKYKKLTSDARKYNEVIQQNIIETQRFLEMSKLATFSSPGKNGFMTTSVDFSGIQEILDRVESGSLSATEAIIKLKEQYGSMIDLSNTEDIGAARMERLEAALAQTVSMVKELHSAMGGVGGVAGAPGQTIIDMAVGSSEEVQSDTAAIEAAKQALAGFFNTLVSSGSDIDTQQSTVTNFVSSLRELASVDVSNLELTADILRRIPNIANFEVDEKQIDNLVRSIEKLQQLARDFDLTSLTTLTNINLSGFDGIKVSKASLSNLATYLPQITGANVDMAKLRELSQISLANFDKTNLSISKASFDKLKDLLDMLSGGVNTGATAGAASLSNDLAQKANEATEAIKKETDVTAEAAKGKQLDATAAEAAAKAEDDKRKIAELLAKALEREEEATKRASGASEEDAERTRRATESYQELLRIQEAIGNRRVKIAGLNPEQNAQEIQSLTSSIEMLQNEYNSLYQRSSGDLFDAQIERLRRGFDEISARVSEVTGRMDDIRNSQAETDRLNVALTNVNNTLRLVRSAQERMRNTTGGINQTEYTDLANLASSLEVLSTSGGTARELTSGLKELKLEYSETLLSIEQYMRTTNAAERSQAAETREVNEHARVLEQLTNLYTRIGNARTKIAGSHSIAEVQTYEELAQRIRDVQAADQEEALTVEQLRAVYEELRQIFANVNASAAPLIQQTRDRANAEKEEAQAVKEAERAIREKQKVESEKATLYKQANSLLGQCTEAERKYAAAAKLANAKENWQGIRDTKNAVQELIAALGQENPKLDQIKQRLRELNAEYAKNSTALKTQTNFIGRYVTTGLSQLKSRLTYTFGLAAMVYKTVAEIKKMITTAVELDSAMNELQIVTRVSGEEMEKYSQSVSKMAQETAQATKDLISATTVYARLGYSMDESAVLSKYTAMLQGVGNIEAQAAQDAVTAIVKAFNIGVDQIEVAMDKMVVVGNNFPISVSQIAEGMNNAGSMLAVAGNSFEESIALLTAANTTIQNISKASTGLRTIAARIRKMDTEDGEIVEESKYNAMIDALTRHHVQLVDANGEYRKTYDIIKDIAAVWKDMSTMQQAAVVEALAGTRQQNIFASLMTQFGEAEGAMKRMQNSAGELQEAFDIKLESIEAHVKQLKSAFDRLSMDFVDSDLAKGAVDLLTQLLKLLDTLVQKLGGIGTLATLIGGSALLKNLPKITKTLKEFFVISEAQRAGGWLFDNTGPYKALNGLEATLAKIASFAPVLIPLFVAIAGAFVAKKFIDEKSFEHAADEAKKTQEELDKLKTKQEEVRKSLNDLYDLKAKGDFSAEQQNELERLEAQNATLQAQIELYKQLNYEKQKKAHDNAVDTAERLLSNPGDNSGYSSSEAIGNYLNAKRAGAKREAERQLKIINGQLETFKGVLDTLDAKEDADLIKRINEWILEATAAISDVPYEVAKARNELEKIQAGGNADLVNRQAIDSYILRKAGYDVPNDSGAVVTPISTFSGKNNEGKEVAMNFTPVIVDENGNYQGVLTPENLQDYANGVISGVREDTLGLKIGATFEGDDALDDARKSASDIVGYTDTVFNKSIKDVKRLRYALSMLSDDAIKGIISNDYYTEDIEEVKNVIQQFYNSPGDFFDAISNNQTVMFERVYRSYDIAKRELDEVQQEIIQKDIDIQKTVFGNIDTNKRQVIDWTYELASSYKNELESWGMSIQNVVGSVSTVLGSSGTYEGIEVAFSPILQTDKGPVLLSRETVDEYIFDLIDELNEAKKDWSEEDLLKLDARGIEKDGKKIKGLIADIGETSEKTAQTMHYLGKDGALALAENEVRKTAEFFGDYIDEFNLLLQNGDVLDDHASKWRSIKDITDSAKRALEEYNETLKEGNSGDIAKSMQEAWQTAMEDIDKGKVSSKAVIAFAKMAFDHDTFARIMNAPEVRAQMIRSMNNLFDDNNIENGYSDEDNPDSYGMRFIKMLEREQSRLSGVKVWREGNTFYHQIEDYKELAKQLGLTEGFLDAMIEDAAAFDDGLLMDNKQANELVGSLNHYIETISDAREATKEFVREALRINPDSTQEELESLLYDMHGQGYLSLDPTEYTSLVEEVLEDTEKKASEADALVSMHPNAVELYAETNNMLEDIQLELNESPVYVRFLSDDSGVKYPEGTEPTPSQGSIRPASANGTVDPTIANGFASGKHSGDVGGKTLVNELGPELISDNGKAFIANGGKPGFVNLSKDAIVFTADETKKILRGQKNVSSKSLANGTDKRSLINRLTHGGTAARARVTPTNAGTTITKDTANAGTRVNQTGTGNTTVINNNTTVNTSSPSQHSTSTYTAGWTCPYCGNYNGPHSNYCSNPNCPTRKKYEPNPAAGDVTINRTEKTPGAMTFSTPTTGVHAQWDATYTGSANPGKTNHIGDGGGNNVGGSDYASQSDPQKVDWVAVRLNRIQRAIADLEKVASSGFKKLDTRLTSATKEIEETKWLINNEERAYSRYLREAESVGLDSSIANLVQDGTIDITKYDDETRKKIDEYTEWYEKALDAQSSIEELHQQIAQLYVNSFQNVQTDFENQLAQIEHDANMTQKNLEMAQAKGYLDSASFYQQLSENETQSIEKLNKELEELNKQFLIAMNSGEIEEQSEAWYEMRAAINAVKEEIADANIQLVEYQRTIRSLDWSNFDYAQERFNQLQQEANFFIQLMSNDKLFQDNGQFNNLGAATAGMHAVNYNAYMTQADEYAKEIEKINRDLVNDPYDTELISRRETLLGLQQQSIQAAESEKDAVKSLVQQGITIELEALKKLIDKYKESIDSAKDLYEYQKKLAEQTGEVASLEKQLSAYANDTSEETRAKVQQLNKSLKEARTTLQETERDKSISDQKKLLDDLYQDYEDLLNGRLDNVDALMQEIIAGTNANSGEIQRTLRDEAEKVGYTVSDMMTTAISNDLSYYDKVFQGFSSVGAVLTNIYDMVAAMARASGAVKAYATGGLVDYTGLAAVHGTKRRPELMLSANDTENFLTAANLMRDMFTSSASSLPTNIGGQGAGMSIGQIQVNIPIDRVLDYNDLVSQMRDDPKFEKLINAMTLDRAVGKSGFGKNRIVF